MYDAFVSKEALKKGERAPMFTKLPVTSNARTVGRWVDLAGRKRFSATVAADVLANATSAITAKTTSVDLKLSCHTMH